MKKLFLLGLLCMTAFTMHAQRYAVLEFEAAKGISVTEVDGISEMFATYFRPKGYTEVDRSHVNKVVSEQRMQNSAVTEEMAVLVGRIMNVSKVVVGKVSMLGGQYQVDVKVVDVQSERVVDKDGITVAGNYREKVRELAQRLAARIAVSSAPSVAPAKTSEYVDLGLPSGTLWKSTNEKGGFMTWEEAKNKYGDKLPTMEQMEELKGMCTWKWTGKGYTVTGPNGNTISLPAAGCRTCDGSVEDVGTVGNFWSSTPKSSGNAWGLAFTSDVVGTYYAGHCNGVSVRLVQD